MTEIEADSLRDQLSDILENFEALQQVNTTDIPPTAQSVPLQNVMRDDDKIVPSLLPSQILTNAPHREEDFFRVRAVLE